MENIEGIIDLIFNIKVLLFIFNIKVLLFLVSIIIFAQIVLGPILVHSMLKHSAYPQFEACNFGDLPYQQHPYFLHSRTVLENEGFEWLGTYLWRLQNPMYLGLLKHCNRRDMATIVYTKNVKEDLCYVEFSSEFIRKGSIDTNNSPQVGAFQKFPDKRTFSFPQIKDIHRLYVLHRALIKTYIGDAESVVLEDGTELEELKKSMTKDMKRQIEAGYFYFDDVSELYRPTWKGAILMTWKLVWPVGTIRKILLRRQAEAVNKQLATIS